MVIDALERVPQTELLGQFVRDALKDDEGASLIDFRDVFLHRGRVPQHHWEGGPHHRRITVASNPKGIPSAWRPDRYFEPGGLDLWGDWLGTYVTWATPLIRDALNGLP